MDNLAYFTVNCNSNRWPFPSAIPVGRLATLVLKTE